jgi:hypothetical protein
MKLYNVERYSYFTLENDTEVFFFDHIDGGDSYYSYCLNEAKQVIHFGASTEVNPLSAHEVYCYITKQEQE